MTIATPPLAVEKNGLRIGIMPLIDAAPIMVAHAMGFFARHGLEVEIALERAWAAVRDKLAAERLDAAQMLAPMPLAATLGLDAVREPMVTALALNLNGNAIVVSNSLHSRLQAISRWGPTISSMERYFPRPEPALRCDAEHHQPLPTASP